VDRWPAQPAGCRRRGCSPRVPQALAQPAACRRRACRNGVLQLPLAALPGRCEVAVAPTRGHQRCRTRGGRPSLRSRGWGLLTSRHSSRMAMTERRYTAWQWPFYVAQSTRACLSFASSRFRCPMFQGRPQPARLQPGPRADRANAGAGTSGEPSTAKPHVIVSSIDSATCCN
jgi:hypothetical protein